MKKLGFIEEKVPLPSVNATHEIDIFYGEVYKPQSMEYPENMLDVCAKNNIITFDELIIECTDYFKKTGGSIEYLLVDEFQDIGMNEYEFIMALNAEHNFFVGDDWQSLYAFKGGDVQIFLSLMNDKNWKSYHMSTNYRNATQIVDLGKKVIRQADDIIDKEVSAARDETGYVRLDSRNNLYYYLNNMKNFQDYKDWFILARTNKEVYELSQILTKAKVPFHTFKQGAVSTEELNKIMNSNTVKLLTVHASKGLESKKVIVYGNFQVQVPRYKNINSDERKVFYVAITRAMDQLIILN
jgi:superfamily I DNA/RNA helicase